MRIVFENTENTVLVFSKNCSWYFDLAVYVFFLNKEHGIEFCTEIVHLEKKNIKYNVGFKNMPKLVRLGMGGNDRRCERRPLANLKVGVHNAGY